MKPLLIILLFIPAMILANPIFYLIAFIVFITVNLLLILKNKKIWKNKFFLGGNMVIIIIFLVTVFIPANIEEKGESLKVQGEVVRVTKSAAWSYNPFQRSLLFFQTYGEGGCSSEALTWSNKSEVIIYQKKCQGIFNLKNSYGYYNLNDRIDKVIKVENSLFQGIDDEDNVYFKTTVGHENSEKISRLSLRTGRIGTVEKTEKSLKNSIAFSEKIEKQDLLTDKVINSFAVNYFSAILKSPDGQKISFTKMNVYGPGDLFLTIVK